MATTPGGLAAPLRRTPAGHSAGSNQPGRTWPGSSTTCSDHNQSICIRGPWHHRCFSRIVDFPRSALGEAVMLLTMDLKNKHQYI